MTGSNTHHPEGTHMSGTPERRTETNRDLRDRNCRDNPIPISQSSIAQTITAVALLISKSRIWRKGPAQPPHANQICKQRRPDAPHLGAVYNARRCRRPDRPRSGVLGPAESSSSKQ